MSPAFWRRTQKSPAFRRGTQRSIVFWRGTQRNVIFWNGTQRSVVFWRGTQRSLVFLIKTQSCLVFWRRTQRSLAFWRGTMFSYLITWIQSMPYLEMLCLTIMVSDGTQGMFEGGIWVTPWIGSNLIMDNSCSEAFQPSILYSRNIFCPSVPNSCSFSLLFFQTPSYQHQARRIS